MGVKTPWYKKYKELSSVSFTFKNSGRCNNLFPPGKKENDKIKTIKDWEVKGWTLNFPIKEDFPSVAIMFESPDFETFWFHYDKYDE